MSAIDEYVGREVHQRMWDRHMTNVALAGQLGITPSALGHKLRGRRDWSLDELLRVAELLDVAVVELLPEPRTGPESTGVTIRSRRRVPSLPSGHIAPVVPIRPGLAVVARVGMAPAVAG